MEDSERRRDRRAVYLLATMRCKDNIPHFPTQLSPEFDRQEFDRQTGLVLLNLNVSETDTIFAPRNMDLGTDET
jgi:hypothetical protein